MPLRFKFSMNPSENASQTVRLYLLGLVICLLASGFNHEFIIESAPLIFLCFCNFLLSYFVAEVNWWAFVALLCVSLASRAYLHYRPYKKHSSHWIGSLIDCFSGYFYFTLFGLGLFYFFAPCYIPSGSMQPTLYKNDFIIARRFYTLKVPFTEYEITKRPLPQRGQVICFYYPPNPKESYIKRIIGMPGDTVEFIDRKLYITPKGAQKPFEVHYCDAPEDRSRLDTDALILIEQLQGVKHAIEKMPTQFHRPEAEYNQTWVVPERSYFVLGDNRDNSSDSRSWGMVPEENLMGEATHIFFSMDWYGPCPYIRWRRCFKRII